MSDDKKEPWLNYMALATVILAVCATLATFKAGGFSTQSVILQAQASDQWAYYQAKSMKEQMHKLQADTLSAQIAGENPLSKHAAAVTGLIRQYREEVARYQQEKRDIQAKATDLETQRDKAKERGKPFGYAVILLQIAILLNSIAGLLKKKTVWWAGIPVSLMGLALFADGFLLVLRW